MACAPISFGVETLRTDGVVVGILKGSNGKIIHIEMLVDPAAVSDPEEFTAQTKLFNKNPRTTLADI